MRNIAQKALNTALTQTAATLHQATAKRVSLNNQTAYSRVSHYMRDVGHRLMDSPNKSKQAIGTLENPAIGTMDNPLRIEDTKAGNPNYVKHHLGKIEPHTFFNRANNIEICNKALIETTHANGITAPHGYSCKDRLCFTCQSIKAHKRTIMYQRTLAQTILDNQIQLKNLRLIMLTISPPNVPLEDTRNTTKALNAVMHNLLTKKKFLRHRTAPKETWGYIRGTEWTGKSFDTQLGIGKTHPHVHLLMLTDWDYYRNGTDKKGRTRYLDQAKHEWTKLIESQLSKPIIIEDYNSNERDAEGKPIKGQIAINIPRVNVDVRIVFDGARFARKNAKRNKERIDAKMSNAIFEIIKGFNFSSASESADPKALEYAEDFCHQVKKDSKGALNYPEKGALNPEQIRQLGAIDRAKNKQYKQALELFEQGKISQEELDQHEFKPYFMMFCEQIRGLRTFGSGGVFAKCKLEQIGIDTPPDQARIIHYEAKPAEQLKSPKGKDKKKHLAEYIHEQIGHSNCTLEPVQTNLKGNELALIEQAWGGKYDAFSYELRYKIDRAIDSLDTSQQADKKQVFKAINEAIKAYRDSWYESEKRTFTESPEFQVIAHNIGKGFSHPMFAEVGAKQATFQYCMWVLCKTAYAYGLDKLNNGLSIFCDECEQEKSIHALTAKFEQGEQHVRKKSTSGKESHKVLARGNKSKNQPTKDTIMETLTLSIPKELLAQFQALEQELKENPEAMEQWVLKAFKYALDRKICKKCYRSMERKKNSKDNSLFWKCSNTECNHKEQFDAPQEQKEPEYVGRSCPTCNAPLVYRTNHKNDQRFIGCSRYSKSTDPSKTCDYTEQINTSPSQQQQSQVTQSSQDAKDAEVVELREQVAKLGKGQENLEKGLKQIMDFIQTQQAQKAEQAEVEADDEFPF
ncbi:protein rep [Helicobacter bizzozeronii]|uniref:protein rep n=1 Tax=Helicobacter bizzozeronii TaxID=56877 RepID=UPI001315AB05|nr:protein rep [Helicobacter bizzozeronii]